MKKFAVTALCLLLSFSTAALSACEGGGGSSSGEQDENLIVTELLSDGGYKKGFYLRGVDPVSDSQPIKTVKFGEEDVVWGIDQWWSKYNLKNGSESLTETKYSLSDSSRTVEIDRENGVITLALNGAEEFDSANSEAPVKWPHLLLEQAIPDSFISDAEKIEAKLNFTIVKSDDYRGGSGLQAQFAWFIYLMNRNTESSGFGEFTYFGLNLFDSTKLYAPASYRQDTATGAGSFIYALGADEFMQKRVKVGTNCGFTFDILPEVKKCLTLAQSKGFMLNTKFEDLAITGMNIGWEIFDRWDESVAIFDISIEKTTKGE